jgi:hypothetical protein
MFTDEEIKVFRIYKFAVKARHHELGMRTFTVNAIEEDDFLARNAVLEMIDRGWAIMDEGKDFHVEELRGEWAYGPPTLIVVTNNIMKQLPSSPVLLEMALDELAGPSARDI